MRDLPWRARSLIFFVAATAVALLVFAMKHLPAATLADSARLGSGIFAPRETLKVMGLLVVLVLVTKLAASVAVFESDRGPFGVDQVTPVLMASYLLVGTSGAIIVAASVFLVMLLEQDLAMVKKVFNAGVLIISVSVASAFYWFVAVRTHTDWANSSFTLTAFGLILASSAIFVGTNCYFIAAIVSSVSGSSLLATWRGIVRDVAGPLVVNSVLGLMLATVYYHVGVIAMILVLLPLYVARWVFAQIAGERAAQEATLAALIKAVETKDWYTKGHSERVAVASLQIGGSLKLDPDLMRELRFAGMLQDVGKLGVPTGVLIKPGRLDDAEFDAIKRHPVLGQEVVRGIEFLDEAKRGIYYHHERIDGRGYPEGLKGDEIPLFARILGVADAFDSMTQVRSYRGARSVEAALEELDAHRNTQFDTRMVDALMGALAAGWEPETSPVVVTAVVETGVPALGVDDDDPSAAAALAAHRPLRVDAISDSASASGSGIA